MPTYYADYPLHQLTFVSSISPKWGRITEDWSGTRGTQEELDCGVQSNTSDQKACAIAVLD